MTALTLLGVDDNDDINAILRGYELSLGARNCSSTTITGYVQTFRNFMDFLLKLGMPT
jgi:hypothetical protein